MRAQSPISRANRQLRSQPDSPLGGRLVFATITATSKCVLRNVISDSLPEHISANARRSEMDAAKDPGISNLCCGRRKTRKCPGSRSHIGVHAERRIFAKLFSEDERRGPTYCRMSRRIFRMCGRAGREEIEPRYPFQVLSDSTSSSANRGDWAPEHVAILYVPAGYCDIGHGHIQQCKQAGILHHRKPPLCGNVGCDAIPIQRRIASPKQRQLRLIGTPPRPRKDSHRIDLTDVICKVRAVQRRRWRKPELGWPRQNPWCHGRVLRPCTGGILQRCRPPHAIYVCAQERRWRGGIAVRQPSISGRGGDGLAPGRSAAERVCL